MNLVSANIPLAAEDDQNLQRKKSEDRDEKHLESFFHKNLAASEVKNESREIHLSAVLW